MYTDIHEGMTVVILNDVGLEMVQKEKYAHIADYTVLKLFAANDCSVTVMKETFYTVGLGFVVPEGWPYKK